MARENRRKREARRFGVAERLADLIVDTPPERWRFHPALRGKAESCIASIQDVVAHSPVLVADNVRDYFFDHPQEYWEFKTDFPCVAPPFPSFFIEFSRPTRCVIGEDVFPVDPSCPDRIGFLFDACDAEGRVFLRPIGGGMGCRFERVSIPEARWFIRALPVWADGGFPVYMSLIRYFAVDALGRIVEDPPTISSGLDLDAATLEAASQQITQFLMPCLLAICFANCKNTTTISHEPDPELNRVRLAAGRKPFLRYHVLDIGPVKRILRTEGGIESNGLRKALHIVRGHFATYSEERPLFGRIAGTVWKPAHVRGSIKEGIVIKDYNVKAPSAR